MFRRTGPGLTGGWLYCSSTVRPTIILASSTAGHILIGQRAGNFAVAQYGDAMADRQHFVQLVRDEDQRVTIHRHLLEGDEQVVHLLRGQHGGWLVQHQQRSAAVQRFNNFHALLLADRQLPDRRARVHL